MVAALEDRLPATGVALHGVAVIKHFIAGFNQQEVAIGGDLWRLERAQFHVAIEHELDGVPVKPYLEGLKDENPRVALQSLIG